MEKVGHTGTLDPMATGVLPLLIGKGTLCSKYLMNHNKIYEVQLTLGKKTDHFFISFINFSFTCWTFPWIKAPAALAWPPPPNSKHISDTLIPSSERSDTLYASSSSSMAEYFKIKISKEIGTCLMTGIITDTGGFRYSGVTPETFEFTADLLILVVPL